MAKKKAVTKKKAVASKKKSAAKKTASAPKKSVAKATAKAAPKKTAPGKVASKATPNAAAAIDPHQAQVSALVRRILEDSSLSSRAVFGEVAALLRSHPGYSALNFFRNTRADGGGRDFELLALAGSEADVFYYADPPGDADNRPPRIRVKAIPNARGVLDESGELKLFGLPADDTDSAAKGPRPLLELPEYADAKSVSILYLPFPSNEGNGLDGFVALALVNARPRYTKSDLDPTALLSGLLQGNLRTYALSAREAQLDRELKAASEALSTAESERESLGAELSASGARSAAAEQELQAQLAQAVADRQATEERLAASLACATERQTAVDEQKAALAELRNDLKQRESEVAEARERIAGLASEGERRQSELNTAIKERDEARSQVEAGSARVTELESKQSAELSQTSAEHAAELTRLRESHSAEIERLNAAIQSASADAQNAAEAELKRAQSQAEARLQTETERGEAAAREAREAALREARAEADRRVAELERAADELRQRELDEAQKAADARVALLESQAAAKSDERVRELEERIARLSSAEADADAERELLNEELANLTKQLEAKTTALNERESELADKNRELGESTSSAAEQTRENAKQREHLARLEQELQQQQAARGDLESERQALRTERGLLNERLIAFEGDADDARRIGEERAAEIKRLQEQLATHIAETRELNRANESAARELSEIKSNLGSRDAALQQEQQRASERAEKISALEKDLAAKERELAEQGQSYDELLKAESERAQDAVQELQKARTNIEQKENDYHNSLYELKQKINTLNESLDRTRSDARAEAAQQQAEIQRLNSAAAEQQTSAERERAELEKRRAELETRFGESQREAQELKASLQQEQQSLHASQQSGENQQRQIGELQSALSELEASKQREIERLNETAKSRAEEHTREIASRDSAIAAAHADTEEQRQRAESLGRDSKRLRDENAALQANLNRASQLERKLREEIEAGVQKAAALTNEVSEATERGDGLLKERNESREENARLRQDIGIRREREARQEQAIAGLQNDIRGLNDRISSEQQTQRQLGEKLKGVEDSLQTTRSELSEQYQKERRLNDELGQALAREKGSEQEGRLLASLTNAISNLPAFSDKIRYLRENVPGTGSVERVAVYRLQDEDTLVFEDGYQGKTRLSSLIGQRVSVQQTGFGQALVQLEPQRLAAAPDRGLSHPDLPGELGQITNGAPGLELETLRSFLCLPLTESGQGVGVLVLAAGDARAFDDKRMRILANVAPLFAVAVRFERNQAELNLHRDRIRNFQQVTRYQERRYLRTAGQLQRLSSEVLPALQQDSAGSAELLQKLTETSQRPLPTDTGPGPDALQRAADLLQWVDSLGARISGEANLNFEQSLDLDLLGRLAERLGAGFQNLYWLFEEALENVGRHAQASRLRIDLAVDPDENYLLEIIDNGEGLVRTAGTDRPQHGSGLNAIRDLAAAAGGQADFARDEQGHGLALQIRWQREESDLDAALRSDSNTARP